jgi:hypothetical protein
MKYILVFIGLLLITFKVYPQSVIYKKNGETIPVYNLIVTGKNLSYNLPGDPGDLQRLMSVSIVDSLKHEDGTTDVFINSGISHIIPAGDQKLFNRFLLGADVAALTFYNNLKVSFEYLPGKGYIGLYVTHSVNTNPQNLVFYENSSEGYFYGNFTKLLHWNTRAGINAYLFRPGSFRLSSGLHYTHGKFTEETWKQLDEPPWSSTSKLIDKSFNAIILSPGLNWQLNRYLRTTFAIDIGIYKNLQVYRSTILRSEIQLNF